MDPRPLTPKQRKFAAEYAKDGNGTQAAIRAGYSAKTAYSQAHDLLKKPEVRALLDERMEKLDIRVDDVLRGIKQIADEGVEEHNRLKAYELLGKHLKLFTEKIEHSGGLTLEQLVVGSMKKPEPPR